MVKTSVDGIILVTSCQKYKNTRLKELMLKESYGNWKVIQVVGDLFLDCDYKMDGNLMTIKCEDSYIYNLKKFIFALQYLYEMFEIRDGVLRSNDDLEFNEPLLIDFLETPKKIGTLDIDFLGRSSTGHSLVDHPFTYEPQWAATNYHLVQYYETHPEDFENPLHNIK